MSLDGLPVSPSARMVVRDLFLNGPTWTADLPSRMGMDELIRDRYVATEQGWAFLLQPGVALGIFLGYNSRKAQRDQDYMLRTMKRTLRS